jgi:hypothetical protein
VCRRRQSVAGAAATPAAASRLAADPATDLWPYVAAVWAIAGLCAARERWDRGASGRGLPSLLAEAYALLSGDLAGALAPRSDRPRLPA